MQSVKFKKPPLIEVVFGIDIIMPELSLVHFGLYWNTIKEKFPTPIESFGELELTEDSSYVSSFPSILYLSSEENRLIKLTENSFSYHCICINDDYQYFDNTFKEFVAEWKNLESFFSEVSEEPITIKSYGLQYINLIDDLSGWKKPEDNSKIFNFLKSPVETKLGYPISNYYKLLFNLPSNYGQLLVTLDQRKFEESEVKEKEIMIFSLSAFSFEDDIVNLDNWFRYSHDFIIQSFLDLTTVEVQKTWERLYE